MIEITRKQMSDAWGKALIELFGADDLNLLTMQALRDWILKFDDLGLVTLVVTEGDKTVKIPVNYKEEEKDESTI